jgi:hypothetical protein
MAYASGCGMCDTWWACAAGQNHIAHALQAEERHAHARLCYNRYHTIMYIIHIIV